MTKRDACRSLQTSILTQHEADKTRSTTGTGTPVSAWGGGGGERSAGEKGERGQHESVIRGINRADGRTDRQKREGERNNKTERLRGSGWRRAAGERKEGTRRGGGVKDG